MNDSRDFQDAESVRSGPSHVPSQPAFLPPYRDPGGSLSRNNQPPDIWNSQGLSGSVFFFFFKSTGVFFVTLSRRIHSWISDVTEDTSPHVTGERQIPDTVSSPRFEPGLSAGNSFDPKE